MRFPNVRFTKSGPSAVRPFQNQPNLEGEDVTPAKPLKRYQRRRLPRTGITILTKDTRADQILEDPESYFELAREKAAENVSRDLKLISKTAL